MKIKTTDEQYREDAPYLFENEGNGHAIHVIGPDSEGDLRISVDHVRYVPGAVRNQRAANSRHPHPDRAYEWSGVGLYITRKQALKLAAKLIKQAAKDTPSDD